MELGDPDQVLAARDLHRRVLGLLAALPPATSDLVARRRMERALAALPARG